MRRWVATAGVLLLAALAGTIWLTPAPRVDPPVLGAGERPPELEPYDG